MNTSSIPTNWSDPRVKAESVAVKYRKEQELTCSEAILACPTRNLAVELYAGTGGLTKIYADNFDTIITNDLNPNSIATYKLTAMRFIEIVLPAIIQKIDLVDFDCYGSPCEEIKEYFKVRKNYDAPFVMRFSDGKGLWMKRFMKRNEQGKEYIRKCYLIEGEVVLEKIWDRHDQLIDFFLKTLASRYGMKAEKIITVQTKFKSYILGAYKFVNI